MIDLTGRVALITGGGRGIGAAVARGLAEAGAVVAVNYVSNRAAAETVVVDITQAGGQAAAFQADVADGEAVTAMVAAVGDSLGPVDILVANAGVAPRQAMEETSEDDFNNVLQVNLTSAFLCSQAVLPKMRQRGWGRLIFVTSAAAYNGGRVGLHYSASKGGMESLSRAYALRLVGEGVTANCLAPAIVQTDMGDTSDPDNPVFSPPVGRSGHVDEVAMAAVMLAANGYMTGQTLHMNGGLYFN
ncbi:MAG: SDR family NAD(P)-dependent oxidoreductase [Alphaproteobacteria bacterium]|nr:SDR family NAD(P)-dependent oxidoreductase [Alphaproteobacteria bacterium]